MSRLNEDDYVSVREAVRCHDISEAALRKALLKERIVPGGIESHHFAGNTGVSVSRASLDNYLKRTRPNGEKPKGRPRTRPFVPPSGQGRGRPRKCLLTAQEQDIQS